MYWKVEAIINSRDLPEQEKESRLFAPREHHTSVAGRAGRDKVSDDRWLGGLAQNGIPNRVRCSGGTVEYPNSRQSDLVKIRIHGKLTAANDHGGIQTRLAQLIQADIVFGCGQFAELFGQQIGAFRIQIAFKNRTLHARAPIFQLLGQFGVRLQMPFP